MCATDGRIHSVVVPTLPTHVPSLQRLLTALESQSLQPRSVILVFPEDAPAPSIRELVSPLSSGFAARIVLIRARKGTASQRNAGLRAAMGDVIHFLDDDVVPGPSYFEDLDAAYSHRRVVGAMGRFTDLCSPSMHPLVRAFRWLALASPGAGRVSKAAVNQPPDESDSIMSVEWMSGGCCSMRREVALELMFDERLELGPRGPYALGEDLDFSHRASKRGALIRVGTAHISHPQELTESTESDRYSWYRARALMRRYLATKAEHDFSRVAVSWSHWCEIGWLLLLIVRGRLSAESLMGHVKGSTEGLEGFRASRRTG